MGIFAELADNGLYGCTLVVGAPRKLMWASWLIQPGQSLTSRPEQNFACREVANYAKPKRRRIVGHNESEGMEPPKFATLHEAKGFMAWKPVSLHALEVSVSAACRGLSPWQIIQLFASELGRTISFPTEASNKLRIVLRHVKSPRWPMST